MAHQNCPGILQVEMRYVCDAQDIYNVFHVGKGDTDPWEFAAIADVIDSFYNTYWTSNQQALLTEEVQLAEIVATDLTSLSAQRIVRPIVPDEIGTHLGTVLPNNVTLAVKLAPATRGRGSAGRIFWPPTPEDEVAGDQYDNAYVSSIVTCFTDLMGDLLALAESSKLVVLSRVLNGAPRANGIGKDVVSVGASDLYCDSQKLRLPRHKRTKRTP